MRSSPTADVAVERERARGKERGRREIGWEGKLGKRDEEK